MATVDDHQQPLTLNQAAPPEITGKANVALFTFGTLDVWLHSTSTCMYASDWCVAPELIRLLGRADIRCMVSSKMSRGC